MFAGDHKMTFDLFTGPGRLAIQTLYLEPVESEAGAGSDVGAARAAVWRARRSGDFCADRAGRPGAYQAGWAHAPNPGAAKAPPRTGCAAPKSL